MIKIFHAPGSRSVRIIWLLEELGLDYELEVLKRGEVNEAFIEASPFSKLPTIIDGQVPSSRTHDKGTRVREGDGCVSNSSLA